MDRNTVIGFVLIGLVLMVWMWMNAPQQSQHPPAHQDSTTTTTSRVDSGSLNRQSVDVKQVAVDTLGIFFKDHHAGTEQHIVIDGELYRAQISSKGGAITSWELKNFKHGSDRRSISLIRTAIGILIFSFIHRTEKL